MKKAIIIVEDEKPMLKALTIKLQNEGFMVVAANDADAFFRELKKQNFDLILLDLMLPKISGFEVLEKLQAEKNKIPVIISSNLSQKEDKERAIGLGAVDFIVKSESSLIEIVAKIKSFLD